MNFYKLFELKCVLAVCVLEADIFSGIPRDGKQNRYESRDWDGTGKNATGVGGTGIVMIYPTLYTQYTFI